MGVHEDRTTKNLHPKRSSSILTARSRSKELMVVTDSTCVFSDFFVSSCMLPPFRVTGGVPGSGAVKLPKRSLKSLEV